MREKEWSIDENSIRKLYEIVDEVLEEIKILKGMVQKMANATANTLDSLTNRVKDQETLEDGIAVMLAGLIAASGGDPVKMQALADELTKSDAKLAAMSAALIAGTKPPVPTNVLTITPSVVQLAAGKTQQLAVTDSNGLDITASALFTGADPAVATVSTAGLVTGVAAGATSISVSSGTASGSVNVTVA